MATGRQSARQAQCAEKQLDNIRWICSAVPKAVTEFKRRREKFTKIVLDPPRAGAKEIATTCPSWTQAAFFMSLAIRRLWRAIYALTKHSYRLRMVQPFDFFPQTFHVETLAVLDRLKWAVFRNGLNGWNALSLNSFFAFRSRSCLCPPAGFQASSSLSVSLDKIDRPARPAMRIIGAEIGFAPRLRCHKRAL